MEISSKRKQESDRTGLTLPGTILNTAALNHRKRANHLPIAALSDLGERPYIVLIWLATTRSAKSVPITQNLEMKLPELNFRKSTVFEKNANPSTIPLVVLQLCSQFLVRGPKAPF